MHETARVHFGVAHPWLCDSMGHLTSRHYVAMFDDASYHFFRLVFGYDAATVFFDLVARRARSLTEDMRRRGARWTAPVA